MCFMTFSPNTLIYTDALQKLLEFFKKKKCRICEINVLNFTEMLTNDVINFEKPGP